MSSTLLPQAHDGALERYRALPSRRERPGQFWRIDLDNLDLSAVRIERDGGAPRIELPRGSTAIACDLRTAQREYGALLARALDAAVDLNAQKFANLSAAYANSGAFVYVPRNTRIDEPIRIAYTAGAAALFARTAVLLEDGAAATIVESVEGSHAGAFVCSTTEIVAGERAEITFASLQTLPPDARAFFTRAAKPGRDARLVTACAEIGAALSAQSLDVDLAEPGAQCEVTALFFPRDEQHVDLVSTVDHIVGQTRSQTLVKSAATGRGQARYLGNIRIAEHAQGSNATLRDDALLLSEHSHIDSVPALEIAANDVKAYHGATVGALDEEQIFYMRSRGMERSAAERMIALGFFEPAVDHFPTQALREQIRTALESKIG